MAVVASQLYIMHLHIHIHSRIWGSNTNIFSSEIRYLWCASGALYISFQMRIKSLKFEHVFLEHSAPSRIKFASLYARSQLAAAGIEVHFIKIESFVMLLYLCASLATIYSTHNNIHAFEIISYFDRNHSKVLRIVLIRSTESFQERWMQSTIIFREPH